jgi:hypothetical protein
MLGSSGQPIAAYVRAGFGAAYFDERLLRTSTGAPPVIRTQSTGFAAIGNVCIGVEVALTHGLGTFLDLGLHQIMGSHSSTSGMVLLGVTVRPSGK